MNLPELTDWMFFPGFLISRCDSIMMHCKISSKELEKTSRHFFSEVQQMLKDEKKKYKNTLRRSKVRREPQLSREYNHTDVLCIQNSSAV